MKPKPDVSRFVRDPNEFLNGAETGTGSAGANVPSRQRYPQAQERQAITMEVVAPEATVQKLFRLRWSVVQALRAAVAWETQAQGRRVTETEIVEGLLRERYMQKS